MEKQVFKFNKKGASEPDVPLKNRCFYEGLAIPVTLNFVGFLRARLDLINPKSNLPSVSLLLVMVWFFKFSFGLFLYFFSIIIELI